MTRRSRGRPPGRTERGTQTREHLYTTAIQLFADRGYEATTLRAIATEAGVSPGLMYKYFPSKPAIVLELYERLSTEFVARPVADGGWFARFVQTLRNSLDTLGPHRDTLRSVLPTLLVDDETGLFSPAGRPARDRVQGAFLTAVAGASNAPGDLNQPLGRLLDLAQLGTILWWLLDRSRDQRATEGLIGWVERLEFLANAALWAPGTAGLLTSLDQLATEALNGSAAEPDPA